MIIKSSNVSCTADRNYEKTVHGERKATEWKDSDPSRCTVSVQEYYSRCEESALYTSYNASGKLMYQQENGTKEAAYEQAASQQQYSAVLVGSTSTVDSVSAYIERARDIVTSLLDLLFNRNITYLDTLKDITNGEQISVTSQLQGRLREALQDNSGEKELWNRSVSEWQRVKEKESTTFAGKGTAVTADGRELEFGITFSMSREFEEKYELTSMEQYERVLTDPIVISLNDSPVTLKDQTFFFDIDSDGEKEELSQMSSGSGFLVYDRNEDGIINDGSELFGAATGNGYGELAKYDEDNNGWIDEADEIYNKLKIWIKDDNGNDVLISLKDADVGAIYLGSTNADYTYKDSDGQTDAKVRRMGMYLHENGSAGSMMQMDFANHAV